MRRLSILLCIPVVAATIGVPSVGASPQNAGKYIVVLKRGVDPDKKAAEHGRRYGVVKHFSYWHAINGYAGTIPDSKVADIRRDPDVRSVTRDFPMHAAAQTTPTGVARIRAPETLDKGAGVNVAVLDTGIDTSHPDLAPIGTHGKNCSTGSSYNDTSSIGHGTHVAGIIGALDNGVGVVGVAPAVTLWAVRVLNNAGSGDESTLVCGLDFVDSKAPANGGSITVANMSIEASGSDNPDCGNGAFPDPLHQAICAVYDDGVTVVVAAGNDGAGLEGTIPAAYNQVIAVTALSDSDGLPCGLGPDTSFNNSDDTFANFSNYAALADDQPHTIAAPGDDILSTFNDGGYATMSGTSMASPHVAGAAALYIAEHPGSTPAQVLAGLKAAGEPPDLNVNGECTSGVSHSNSNVHHPEPLVQITPSTFVVQPQTSATAPVIVHFEEHVSGLDDTNLILTLQSSGATLPATVGYDDTTQDATITPDAPLLPGEYYAVTVSPDGSTPPTDSNNVPIPKSTVGFRGSLLEQETSVWAQPYYWRTVSMSSAYGSRYVEDKTAGAWATFTFTGTSISWYTLQDAYQGKARVEIDGVVKGTYDNYRSSAQYRYKRSWGLSSGTHTIRIVALGTKSAAAKDAYATIDAFGVGSTLYSNPDLTVSWRALVSTIASGGRVYQDRSAGANVYFHFRGTGIDWRTFWGPDQGIAKVYIDGSYKGQFDGYASSTRARTWSFTHLSNAAHTFRIVVAGTKRSSSSNTYVTIDYFHVI